MVNIKVAVGFVVAALLLGLVAGTALADDEDGSETREVAGGLLVSDRTKLGAVTAAAKYSQAIGEALLASSQERRALLDQISTEDMAEEILAAQEKGYDVLDEAFDLPKANDDVVARDAALGYRLVSYSEDSARVEVWAVSVVGKAGIGTGPAAGYGTTTTDLRWERNSWRLAGPPETKDGPTPPMLGSATEAEQLTTAINAYKSFSHVAR